MRREKSIAYVGIRTPGSPARVLVTVSHTARIFDLGLLGSRLFDFSISCNLTIYLPVTSDGIPTRSAKAFSYYITFFCIQRVIAFLRVSNSEILYSYR